MKRLIVTLIGFLMLQSWNVVAQEKSAYRLSIGDIISVKVFDEPDLSVQKAKISDDGSISVPLLGQVQIDGKTVNEVEQRLTKLFGDDYLKKPSVTVSVDEYRPFYINGEVKKPGSYPYRINMTVQIAVTIAGGFTERAAKEKIFLLKENSDIKVEASLSDQVNPGDVITIEESFF